MTFVLICVQKNQALEADVYIMVYNHPKNTCNLKIISNFSKMYYIIIKSR